MEILYGTQGYSVKIYCDSLAILWNWTGYCNGTYTYLE
jgi:hypothetical protein